MRFEQETVVHKDATIGNRIDEAETKATHYMTDTTNGVKVHPDNDTANYVLIQNGMEIFRNNVSVANYGSSTRIGKDDKSHISINNSRVATAGYDGNYVCSFGTSNDDNTGLAAVEETYIATNISGQGFSAIGFWLEYEEAEEIIDCYINGQEVSDISDILIHDKRGIYSNLFSVGDVVKVKFSTLYIVPVFSFGQDSVASGTNSVSLGHFAVASGYSSFASNRSTAIGPYSNSSGYRTTAEGGSSHSEGFTCRAIGSSSHAEGSSTITRGTAAHSEGVSTEANGLASHSGGYYTKANSNYQTAIGKYNKVDDNDNYAFIIGNGSGENSRSNALAVSWDGDVNGSKLGVETITDWDTSYNNVKSRILFGNDASNGPASGAQIIGIELNNSANNRMQICFRVGSGTSNSFFVRHAPNGTWGTWTEFGGAPTSTSTGINGINAVKNGIGTAMLYFASFSFAANTGTDSTAYRLPAGLRPPVTLDLVSTHNNVRFFVTTDGYIRPAVATTAATAIRGTFTFIAS